MTMKAFQFKTRGGPLEAVQVPIPTPNDTQVKIRVLACGICHSDVGPQYGSLSQTWPRTPGHEVAGIVEAVGSKVTSFKKGDYVGVGWFGGKCGECLACKKNMWVNCDKVRATGDHIDGGYAEYMVAEDHATAHIPHDLDPNDAGPLMCGGITTFNALRNSGAVAGDVVVIQGLGGLGHLAVQYARKMGFYTVVASRGGDKEALAKKLGAHLYIDSEKQDTIKEILALGGARVILCTAPSAKAVEDLIPAIGLNGQLLLVAIILEGVKVPILTLLRKNGSLRAWSSGDSRDIGDTLQFSVHNDIKPTIEVYPLDKAPAAYEHMLSNKARFRVVLEVSKK